MANLWRTTACGACVIDVGTGLPTRGNVHEVVRQAAPDTQVVYVDNAPPFALMFMRVLRFVPDQDDQAAWCGRPPDSATGRSKVGSGGVRVPGGPHGLQNR